MSRAIVTLEVLADGTIQAVVQRDGTIERTVYHTRQELLKDLDIWLSIEVRHAVKKIK